MLYEFWRAFWQAAVPVFITSFLLIWWALKHNYFGKVSSVKEMGQRVKLHSRASKRQRKNNKRQRKNRSGKRKSRPTDHELDSMQLNALNPVHNKWLAFGGGFYGVIALLTYAVIELTEIRDFLRNFDGFFALLTDISIDHLIRLFINSMLNFFWSIGWPIYWLDAIRGDYPWVWLLAAYCGYWLGCRAALDRHGKQAKFEG